MTVEIVRLGMIDMSFDHLYTICEKIAEEASDITKGFDANAVKDMARSGIKDGCLDVFDTYLRYTDGGEQYIEAYKNSDEESQKNAILEAVLNLDDENLEELKYEMMGIAFISYVYHHAEDFNHYLKDVWSRYSDLGCKTPYLVKVLYDGLSGNADEYIR